MESSRRLLAQVLVGTLFVSLPTSVSIVERHPDCCEKAIQQIRDLEDRVDTLSKHVSKAIGIEHRFSLQEQHVTGVIKQLQDGINALKNGVHNEMHKALQAKLGKSLSEVHSKIQKGETEIRQIKGDVTELKADRTSLRDALERTKLDLNQSIARDVSLETSIVEVKRMISAEVKKPQEDTKNVTELITQHPLIQGWQPDDDADCPGLNVLAASDELVLSTEPGGRYRVSDLPSDPMPVGSVVRFHCVPSGYQRLVGERVLRCLGKRGWSSRPPTCQKQATFEPGPFHFPLGLYIIENGLAVDGYVSADDDGSLIVRPGRTFDLACLDPMRKGTVWRRHNDTVVHDAVYYKLSEVEFTEALNLYRMQIINARPYHSGTYSCGMEDGGEYSISIKIADVYCAMPASPRKGDVELDTSPPISVGKIVKFRCWPGYKISGAERAICLGSGRWSRLPPTCKRAD